MCWGQKDGVRMGGARAHNVGSLTTIRVMFCLQTYILISYLTCGFCLFSSWIIPVSGLQYFFYLLHCEYTER